MKLIKKLMPISVYDIAQTQSYLSDMSSKGYHLKKLATFAYFEKGKPEDVTYRLEPLMRNEKKPEEEQLTHFESFGWEYVCTLTKAFHVYKTNKNKYTEIHTDPITQSYAFEYLDKNLKVSFILSVILWPLALTMMLYSVFFNSHPVLFAVKYGNVSSKIMMLLLAFFTLGQVIINRRKIRLLLKKLETGYGMVHNSSYKSSYTHYVFNGLIILFSVLTMISSFFMISADWKMNLSQFNENIPTIQLADIERAQNFEIEKDSYRGSHISYDWTELAPAIYEINERGVVADHMWEDQSGEYSPSLSTEYYQLRFGFLKQPLLEELIDDELEFFRFEPILYQEILETNFEKAVFIQVKETQMFFGILDKSVIYVRYHGYEDLREHFEDIYNKAKNFQ